LADPLFFVFDFGQPIDHLPAALFEVSGFRVGTLIVFCAAHRVLSSIGVLAAMLGQTRTTKPQIVPFEIGFDFASR